MTPLETPSFSFRLAFTNAFRFWEPRRLIYNGALAIVVVGCFLAGWPVSRRVLNADTMLLLFILAVLANVAYCAAYLPDLAMQHSALRDSWLRWRWLLLLIGTLFASAITYLFVSGMMGLDPNGNW